MSSPGYRLPCAYCVEGTSFPSSEALKKHLVSSHENIISRGTSSGVFVSGKNSRNRIPSSDVTKKLNNDVFLYRSNVNSSIIDRSASSGVFGGSVNDSRDSVVVGSFSEFSDNRIKRLNEIIRKKDETISDMLQENERLKSEFITKEEKQSRLRQKWKSQAEDAMRFLKTENRDLVANIRSLEKQLRDNEEEKLKLCHENDKIAKDYADLQMNIAEGKRSTQLAEENCKHKQGSKSEDAELRVNELLTDLRVLKTEKESIQANLSRAEKNVKLLHAKNISITENLQEEKKKYEDLNHERIQLKGQIAMLEASCIQSESDAELQKKNITNMESKINRLASTKSDVDKQVMSYSQTISSLRCEIESLRREKNKMIDKLEKTDDVLSKLSFRISSPSHSKSSVLNAPASFYTDEARKSFDQIMCAIQNITAKTNSSSQEELTRTTSQLHNANIKLMEEKAKIHNLKSRVNELETYLENNDDVETQLKKQFTELQRLRSKHKKCIKNDKARKQMKAEKRRWQRKCGNLDKELQFVTVLYNSTKEELAHEEQIFKDFKLQQQNSQTSQQQAAMDALELKQEILQRDATIEKYKRESCYLLEKLNTTTEEVSALKKKNDRLELKLDDLNGLEFVKESMSDLMNTLSELREQTNHTSTDENGVETLVKRNMALANKVMDSNTKLRDGEQLVGSLNGKIEELESNRYSNEAEIKYFQSSFGNVHGDDNKLDELDEGGSIIENLVLEKEILASRVLILEGIREEMELLRGEKDMLREENEEYKRKMSEYVTSSSALHLADDETVCTQQSDDSSENDFLENVKTLDHLDEEDKSRLKDMLSMPDFQNFLSGNSMMIELKNTSMDSLKSSSSVSSKNLCSDSFEEERVVDHISAMNSDLTMPEIESTEYIQRLHMDGHEPVEGEETIVYVPGNNYERKSLDEIFAESRIIRGDVALHSNQKFEVDTGKVVEELGKVFNDFGGNTSCQTVESGSLTKTKKVQFSHHMVDVVNPDCQQSSDAARLTDASLYRSYFQEALETTYPLLARTDDEDIDDDLNDTSCSSNSGQLSPVVNNREAEYVKLKTTIQNTSEKSDSSSMQPRRASPLEFTQEPIRTQKISTSSANNSDKNVSCPLLGIKNSEELFNSLSDLTACSTHLPRRFVSHETSDKSYERVGVKPLIKERENPLQGNAILPRILGKNGKAEDALKILKSFISKADETKISTEQGGESGTLVNEHAFENNYIDDNGLTIESSTDNVASISKVSGIASYTDSFMYCGNINVNNLGANVSSLNMHRNDEQRMSTPSIPSCMHRPATLDFSDASFNNLSNILISTHSNSDK